MNRQSIITFRFAVPFSSTEHFNCFSVLVVWPSVYVFWFALTTLSTLFPAVAARINPLYAACPAVDTQSQQLAGEHSGAFNS